MIAETMTRDQRSQLLYAETCVVDGGGLMVGVKMNADDHAAMNAFQESGLLVWGRIPGWLLGMTPSQDGEKLPTRPDGVTHWVQFGERAWELAHALRKARARRGPYATAVFGDERVTARIAQATS